MYLSEHLGFMYSKNRINCKFVQNIKDPKNDPSDIVIIQAAS
jgi:hypothetical protein